MAETWGKATPHVEHEVICADCGTKYCCICLSSCPNCSSVHIRNGRVTRWDYGHKEPMLEKHEFRYHDLRQV